MNNSERGGELTFAGSSSRWSRSRFLITSCRDGAKGEGEMTTRPLIASPPWTVEEEEQLRALAESGERPAVIAKRLKRTEQAVRHRFRKLGIPLRLVEPGLKAKGEA